MKRVRIQCVEKVFYDQIVEIEDDQFKELMNTKRSRMEDGGMSPLTSYIDSHEVCDTHGYDDIEIVEVNKNGEPKKNGKEWDGWAEQ